jgi:hypothetical protein
MASERVQSAQPRRAQLTGGGAIVLRRWIARLAIVGVALIGGAGAHLYLAHLDAAQSTVRAQG